MRLVMFAGPIGCGKTTLLQALNRDELVYRKTQTTYFANNVFDTPGEYLEHGRFMHALLLTSYEADLVCLLESATSVSAKIPPGYSDFFPKPVIGVVTKIDVASAEQIVQAKERLELAGVKEIFCVSSVTGAGLPELVERLA